MDQFLMRLLDLGFDKWPLWAIFLLSGGLGLLVGIVVQVFFVKRLKRSILGKLSPLGKFAFS